MARRIEEERYRDERDRHFNRIRDIHAQVQVAVREMMPTGSVSREVTVDEFIATVRKEFAIQRQKEEGYPREQVHALQRDLFQLHQLAQAASREIGIHEQSREFTIPGYIVNSARLVVALRNEIRNKDVSHDYVQFLQERNREGARVINGMSQEISSFRDGLLPSTALAGRIAPPLAYAAWAQVIYPIYQGLFYSEKSLSQILLDRQLEVPLWDPAPRRVDRENITYPDKWTFGAALIRVEVKRLLDRVWQLFNHLKSLQIPGSSEGWAGPDNDDHGRAYYVHMEVKAARGRGALAETELGINRQYEKPIVDMAAKNQFEERLDRRFPLYLDLQRSISKLKDRVVSFSQIPPVWPLQHERDNTSLVPKETYESLAAMLSRMELEYLGQRVYQLVGEVNNKWHRIPAGNADAMAVFATEIAQATASVVASRAELEKPSEIAPATPYPGVPAPLPEYVTAGVPYGIGGDRNRSNNSNGNINYNNSNNTNTINNKKDLDFRSNDMSVQNKIKASHKSAIMAAENRLKNANINIPYNHKFTNMNANNFLNRNNESDIERIKAENNALFARRNQLETLVPTWANNNNNNNNHNHNQRGGRGGRRGKTRGGWANS